MRLKRRSASLVAAAMGALILAPIQPHFASATTNATASNSTLSIHSGSLIVFASGTQTFINPANSYNVAVTNGTKTFYINNSGQFTVSRFALIITLPSNSNVSSFKRCALNVAFTGNNTCASGSPTSVSITPGSPTTYLLSLPTNGFYSFQITQNKSGTMQVHAYANSAYITNYTTHS